MFAFNRRKGSQYLFYFYFFFFFISTPRINNPWKYTTPHNTIQYNTVELNRNHSCLRYFLLMLQVVWLILIKWYYSYAQLSHYYLTLYLRSTKQNQPFTLHSTQNKKTITTTRKKKNHKIKTTKIKTHIYLCMYSVCLYYSFAWLCF